MYQKTLYRKIEVIGASRKVLTHPSFQSTATTLSPLQYSHISVLLPAIYVTGSLLAILEPALAPSGTFEVQGEAAESEETLSELRLVGFSGVNKTEGGVVSLPTLQYKGRKLIHIITDPRNEICCSFFRSPFPQTPCFRYRLLCRPRRFLEWSCRPSAPNLSSSESFPLGVHDCRNFFRSRYANYR